MSAQIELVLRSRQDIYKRLSVFVEPTGLPLAKRWVAELKRVISGPNFLEKDQCFAGFLDSYRNKEFLCAELNRTLEFIRCYRGEGLWRDGYSISEVCSLENLGPALLNKLHHHFEILRGQEWQPSEYLKGANVELLNSLRKLNLFIHQLEAIGRSKAAVLHNGKCNPYSSVHFLTPDMHNRPALLDSDYDDFSLEEDFGLIQIHYSQIGKTHYQAFLDGDQEIGDTNINNVRHYSAGFATTWGEYTTIKPQADAFLAWLTSKGLDPKGKPYFIDQFGVKQGIGYLNVGKIPPAQFGGRNNAEVQGLIASHDDIYQIRVFEDGNVVECTYDYFLDDPQYEQRISAAIKANR